MFGLKINFTHFFPQFINRINFFVKPALIKDWFKLFHKTHFFVVVSLFDGNLFSYQALPNLPDTIIFDKLKVLESLQQGSSASPNEQLKILPHSFHSSRNHGEERLFFTIKVEQFLHTMLGLVTRRATPMKQEWGYGLSTNRVPHLGTTRLILLAPF